MTTRGYCLHLNSKEGQVCIQVNVQQDGGIIVNFKVNEGQSEEEEFQLSFKSDSDVKGLVEMLRWARVSSLKAQGFKVVM